MMVLGSIVSIVYVMRKLGFTDPSLLQEQFYPIYVIGFIAGKVIKYYYIDNQE
jgi:hypothetical protein